MSKGMSDFDDSFGGFRPENEKIRFALEELQNFISKNAHLEERLLKEKEEYFKPFGRLKDSSLSYPHRINAFLNHFIFDARANGEKSPIQIYNDFLKSSKREIERAFFLKLEASFSSLYELLKISEKQVKLKELYSGKKIFVNQQRDSFNLSKGDVFETRVFEVEEKNYFSNYLLIHPIKVRKKILNTIKEQTKQKKSLSEIGAFLRQMQIYHYKWESYQHIDINSIYVFK